MGETTHCSLLVACSIPLSSRTFMNLEWQGRSFEQNRTKTSDQDQTRSLAEKGQNETHLGNLKLKPLSPPRTVIAAG